MTWRRSSGERSSEGKTWVSGNREEQEEIRWVIVLGKKQTTFQAWKKGSNNCKGVKGLERSPVWPELTTGKRVTGFHFYLILPEYGINQYHKQTPL